MIHLRAFAALLALGGWVEGSPAVAARQPGGALAQTPLDSDRSAVQAIAGLARSGLFDDPWTLEESLRLPGLAAEIVRWAPHYGDVTRPATFDAPDASPIRTVRVYLDPAQFQPRRNSFSVAFKRGHCGSLQNIEDAFDARFSVTMVPRLHSGGTFPIYNLEFSAADGRNVHVTLGACAIHVFTGGGAPLSR